MKWYVESILVGVEWVEEFEGMWSGVGFLRFIGFFDELVGFVIEN